MISWVDVELEKWGAYSKACPEGRLSCSGRVFLAHYPSRSLESVCGLQPVQRPCDPPVLCRVYVRQKKALLMRFVARLKRYFVGLFRLFRSLGGS